MYWSPTPRGLHLYRGRLQKCSQFCTWVAHRRFLFRAAIKIVAARSRRRINVDGHMIPTLTDYSPPLAFQRIDERSDDAGGEDCAFDTADEIRKRVDILEQLRRDLDRLLRSPKVLSPPS